MSVMFGMAALIGGQRNSRLGCQHRELTAPAAGCSVTKTQRGLTMLRLNNVRSLFHHIPVTSPISARRNSFPSWSGHLPKGIRQWGWHGMVRSRDQSRRPVSSGRRRHRVHLNLNFPIKLCNFLRAGRAFSAARRNWLRPWSVRRVTSPVAVRSKRMSSVSEQDHLNPKDPRPTRRAGCGKSAWTPPRPVLAGAVRYAARKSRVQRAAPPARSGSDRRSPKPN